jgi:hypothetical protein
MSLLERLLYVSRNCKYIPFITVPSSESKEIAMAEGQGPCTSPAARSCFEKSKLQSSNTPAAFVKERFDLLLDSVTFYTASA